MKKQILMASAAVLALGLATPALAGNDSSIDQIGSGNTIHVTQDASLGAANTSSIEMGTAATEATNTIANVDQSGTGTNGSTISQIGASNGATVTQVGGDGSNNAVVTQNDDNNSAIVTQTGTSASDINVAYTTQNGTQGTAIVTQGEGENTSNITQNGDWNFADVNQGAGGLHESTVEQTGTGTVGAEVNTAIVSQYGASDYSAVTQNGHSNLTTVTQY